MDYKNIIKTALIAIAVLSCYFIINSYIKNEVGRLVQEEKENSAKQLADKTIESEKQRLESEDKLKNQIISLETDNKKCLIKLEETEKKNELKEMSKKDPKRFRKTIDEALGVKGKKK